MVNLTTGAVRGLGSPGELGGPKREIAGEEGFSDVLEKAVRSVDGSQHSAEASLRGLADGTNVDLHGTMIALEEANITLRAMTSVRDKVVEAWQSVWNMPI